MKWTNPLADVDEAKDDDQVVFQNPIDPTDEMFSTEEGPSATVEGAGAQATYVSATA
eukprot:COSAG02_NODE_1415_length_12734_cov_9.846775_3_plen_57_part_00